MRRRLGLGLLVAGACGACWIAPLLVGAAAAGWLEWMEVGLPAVVGGAVVAAAAVALVRRVQRGRRPGACAAPPS